MEISESTWAFIAKHRREDVRDVALHAKHDGDVDVPFALEQIAGWQRASLKLPDWASHDGLNFPPQVPMEQCSSQFTAQYKARLVQRLLAEEAVDDDSPTSLVDLTGGFGVDFSYMSRVFNRAIYVEQQSILCDIARHNFPILGLDHAERINLADSTAVLDTLGRVSMIFLDPARRDHKGIPHPVTVRYGWTRIRFMRIEHGRLAGFSFPNFIGGSIIQSIRPYCQYGLHIPLHK